MVKIHTCQAYLVLFDVFAGGGIHGTLKTPEAPVKRAGLLDRDLRCLVTSFSPTCG